MMILTGVWDLELSNKFLSVLYKICSFCLQISYISFGANITLSLWRMGDADAFSDLMQYVLFYTFNVWKLLLGQTRAVKKLTNEVLTREQNFLSADHGDVSKFVK